MTQAAGFSGAVGSIINGDLSSDTVTFDKVAAVWVSDETPHLSPFKIVVVVRCRCPHQRSL